MSDHVVVKRESLRLILHAARHLTSYLRTEEQEALDDLQDSYEGEPPEMVPMSEADYLALCMKPFAEAFEEGDTTIVHSREWDELSEALKSFNAKFKV